MVDLVDVAIGAVSAFTAAVATGFIGRRRTAIKPLDGEKRCTGYCFGRGVVSKMKDDCTALRAVNCVDGRCTYHCEQMCKCMSTTR